MSIHLDRALDMLTFFGDEYANVVPNEPTESMIKAAQEIMDLNSDTIILLYKTMIGTSVSEPLSQLETALAACSRC